MRHIHLCIMRRVLVRWQGMHGLRNQHPLVPSLTLQSSVMSTPDSVTFVPWNVQLLGQHISIISLPSRFSAWSHKIRCDTHLQVRVTSLNSSLDHSVTFSTHYYLREILFLELPGGSLCPLGKIDKYLIRKSNFRITSRVHARLRRGLNHVHQQINISLCCPI
jgi:hypothetical protein